MKARKPTPKEGKNGLRVLCNTKCKFHAGVPRPYVANDCTYGKGPAYFNTVLCPPACEEYIEEYHVNHDPAEGESKLYYWDDVFVDYSSGLCCVLARSIEHARVVLMEEMLSPKAGFGNGHDLLVMVTRDDPTVIEGSGIVWVHGGG